MSVRGAIAGTMRALLLAAATGGAAFGLLVVFHPFAAATPGAVIAGTPEADDLHRRIEAARDALRQTDTAIAALQTEPAIAAPPDATGLDAQIAAVTERRDLAQRHAAAIRDALKAHADLGALAEIRDSVVIGQLLAQRSALDATIAEQGARFRPNHPTMRGLAAQRSALTAQIEAEATSIAAALDAEARLDATQLAQLQARRLATPSAPADAGTPPLAALQAQEAAQRASLDTLMDSYFGLPSTTTAAPRSDPILGALSPLNLLVVAIAAAAALAAQLGFALRRRRLRHNADIAGWQHDRDPDLPLADRPSPPASPPVLRRAS